MCKKRLLFVLVTLLLSVSLCFTACGEISDEYNSSSAEITKNIVEKETTEDNSETINAVPGSQGLAFQPLSGGTCYISGIGSCTDSDVSIPKYIDGYKVTGIGDKAFYNCKNVKSVTIPDGVTSIGNYAFHKCVNLEIVSVPNSVTSIGAQAFADCASLTNVVIPNKVTRLEYKTFSGCFKLETLTIPTSVTFIDKAVLTSNSLENVYYDGTRAQWNAITNYDYYYQFREFTIHCTDGQILPDNPL